jgi:hypothetical protein
LANHVPSYHVVFLLQNENENKKYNTQRSLSPIIPKSHHPISPLSRERETQHTQTFVCRSPFFLCVILEPLVTFLHRNVILSHAQSSWDHPWIVLLFERAIWLSAMYAPGSRGSRAGIR